MIRITRDSRAILIDDRLAGYARHLVTHFDSVYGQVIPPNGDGVVDFSRPSVHVYTGGPTMWITSLPEEQELIPEYTKYHPGPWNLAFDLGGYCGRTSYSFAKLFKKVVTLEPDQENWRCLNTNIRNLRMENVLPQQLAVAAEAGTLRFFGEGTPGSRIARPEYMRPPFYDVRAVTLADCFEMYGVPDFIKMDIEGAEIEVLDASRDLLREYHPSIVVDTHHNQPDFEGNSRTVAQLLESCGYKIEVGTPGGYWTVWGSR